MTGKIAILRGINVGGKRIIRMEDLKLLFTNLGYKNPVTYIQSGNVLFDAENNISDLKIAFSIEKAIHQKFDFEVPVIVRSVNELKDRIKKNPFGTADINKLHITFLKDKPTQENSEKVESFQYEPDRFAIKGKEIFIYCEGKYHKTKLNNNFFEKQLEIQATTRNWKTLLKLVELSEK